MLPPRYPHSVCVTAAVYAHTRLDGCYRCTHGSLYRLHSRLHLHATACSCARWLLPDCRFYVRLRLIFPAPVTVVTDAVAAYTLLLPRLRLVSPHTGRSPYGCGLVGLRWLVAVAPFSVIRDAWFTVTRLLVYRLRVYHIRSLHLVDSRYPFVYTRVTFEHVWFGLFVRYVLPAPLLVSRLHLRTLHTFGCFVDTFTLPIPRLHCSSTYIGCCGCGCLLQFTVTLVVCYVPGYWLLPLRLYTAIRWIRVDCARAVTLRLIRFPVYSTPTTRLRYR